MSRISDTTAAAVQWTDELTKRQKATLRAHWTELTEHLPAPGVAYEWSEIGVSERLKHYMRHHDLILRDPDVESKWQTSEHVWMWVIEQAGDDEAIGRSVRGQYKLHIDALGTPAASNTTPSGQQATLGGGTIDTVDPVNDDNATDMELVERNLSNGERDDPAERDAGQPPLSRWGGIDMDMDAWDVTAGGSGTRLRRMDA